MPTLPPRSPSPLAPAKVCPTGAAAYTQRLWTCPRCGQSKRLDAFWRLSRDGSHPSGRCRACQSRASVVCQQRRGYKAVTRAGRAGGRASGTKRHQAAPMEEWSNDS